MPLKGSRKSTPTMKGRIKIMSEVKKTLPARTTPARAASTMPSLGPEQSLNRYLSEIRKFPVLTAEQEYMLAKRYAEHQDPEAAKQLVTSHLRLVAKIAMGYRGYGLPVAELISEGNIGLMQGVKKFEPDRGFRLATYAMWWIKASMLIWCGLIGLFRSRASLEIEILALRHQLNILRRKSSKRATFKNIDRLMFAGLYGLAPGVLSALAIVRPETVIRWHRAGFRRYWRWKSRPQGGRPKTELEVRQLIREMSAANPFWGAPRIHGELRKLGIDVWQTTVAKHMARSKIGRAHV